MAETIRYGGADAAATNLSQIEDGNEDNFDEIASNENEGEEEGARPANKSIVYRLI